MIDQKNKIPIKGYATFHPLKHCMVGSGFKIEWFENIIKEKKILDPLKRIAEETEEDYLKLIDILKQANVTVHRPELDMSKYKSLYDIRRPPMTPRDHFAVIGERIYAHGHSEGYWNILKQIDKRNIVIDPTGNPSYKDFVTTARITRIGKDIIWGHWSKYGNPKKYVDIMKNDGFNVHMMDADYHHDGCWCVIKPGCIISLYDIQNYEKNFPGWDVLYLPDQSYDKIVPFQKLKNKIHKVHGGVGGKWWLKGEEHNDQLIEFIETWLNDWVGYVEETVFDINLLSLDENHIIGNYNKDVETYLKKHNVELIPFNFRHRYFWDGGIHCITQDLYREGTMEDYGLPSIMTDHSNDPEKGEYVIEEPGGGFRG